MNVAKVLPYYKISDWEKWEGQWELIEGIPFAMSPAPMPKHQRIALNVAQQFNQQLSNCKNCKVYQAIDWIISEETVLQPDVLVVCGEIKHRLDFPPELVIEILSPSTALKDRNNKYLQYEQQKVKYYLLIDAKAEQVELFVHDGSHYQPGLFTAAFVFSFATGCQASININEVWD